MTSKSYLDGVLGTEDSDLRQYLKTVVEAELGSPFDQTSAVALLTGLYLSHVNGTVDFLPWHDESLVIESGTMKIIETLATNANIRLIHRLTDISKLSNGTYLLGFLVAGKREVFKSKQVIVSLPLTALRSIKTIGFQWPQRFKSIIESINYADVTKLILEFDKPYWLQAGNTGRFVSDLGAIGWDSLPGCNGCPGFLTVYRHYDPAKTIPTSELVDRFLHDLDQLYPGLQSGFKEAYEARWQQAYSYSPRPGELSRKESISTEVFPNGLYISGEAMSEKYRGYMNGAVDSGYLVAERLIESLKIEEKHLTGKISRFRQRAKDYGFQSGGRIVLGQGTIIQGSIDNYGIQPDYKIDLTADGIKSLLEDSKRIGLQNATPIEGIKQLRTLLRNRLPDRVYDSPQYLDLLKNHLATKGVEFPIDLNEYLKKGVGVCREYAYLTNLMLQEIGLRAELIYVRQDIEGVREDHAINLLTIPT